MPMKPLTRYANARIPMCTGTKILTSTVLTSRL